MAGGSTSPAVRAQQMMKTADLVNKFVISTAQFLNRFAAYCESKLLETNRSLQRLETLTLLLEAKIASVDDELKETQPQTVEGQTTVKALGDNVARLMIPDRQVPPPMPGLSPEGGQRRLPPPPPSHQNRKGPPPPPGSATPAVKAPPPPPVPLPPLMPGPPPPGALPVQPPPMPLMGGVPMRSHPRLAGYYQMLALRVPAEVIKEKMRSDGYQPEWLDTPDAVSPSALPSRKRDMYDSD